ncbi:MAG: hypothetical protein M1836_001273 [Candelina mexicana]|nr:MAG: hypothetical protein M1836_001273 [Candelina mexicana]
MAFVSSAHQRVFASVFPTSSLASTVPTPVATPNPNFVAPGQPFGGPLPEKIVASAAEDSSDRVAKQLQWDRAWHTVTSFLRLPDEMIPLTLGDFDASHLGRKWIKLLSQEVSQATAYLLFEKPPRFDSILGNGEDGIELLTGSDEATLTNVLRLLQVAQAVYVRPLNKVIPPGLASLYDRRAHRKNRTDSQTQNLRIQSRFTRDLHAMIANSIPFAWLSRILLTTFDSCGSVILGIVSGDGKLEPGQRNIETPKGVTVVGNGHASRCYTQWLKLKRNNCEDEAQEYIELVDSSKRQAHQTVLQLMRDLESVGLGDERVQRVFAEAMSELMTRYVKAAYAGQWESPSLVPIHLRQWVENCFARHIVEVLNCLQVQKSHDEGSSQGQSIVTLDDVDKWHAMGVGRLGRLRVSELFQIIVEWNASSGAMEDLKHYITTPVTRVHLTSSFAGVLSQRLLHPGASTIEILQIYISLIRAFSMLDPKGVLLDRVARPVRRYLRDREDTVKILVEGLLADTEDEDGDTVQPGGEVLVELAFELNKATQLANQDDDDGELDWDDMRWVPDPVDAGPDYKKSKNSDVLGSLVSMFDSKDVFVKEFQNIMGERLLKRESDFDREIRVLELLKLRFGEAPLQACEVMLRDVQDSKRADMIIRTDQNLHLSACIPSSTDTCLDPRPSQVADLHAKILSRLFWPSLHEETFSIPPEIASLQERYEKGFETLKQSRKLTWLNALGQVTVELDLEDRVVTEEVHTWQASVIYAFQDPDAMPGTQITKEVSELMEQLDMDETLVRNALTFWVGKLVLKEIGTDSFTVLEILDEDSPSGADNAQAAVAAAAEAETSAAVPAVRSAEDVAMEKMRVYWEFVKGMLTNQGPMGLQRIIMMLKFAVPGGFPFADEELREFLTRMVNEGALEVKGGDYKICL